MKILSEKKILMLLLVLMFVLSAGEAQQNKRYVRNPEKDLFGKSLNNKDAKVKESRSVVRAKKSRKLHKRRLIRNMQLTLKETNPTLSKFKAQK